jgi:porin
MRMSPHHRPQDASAPTAGVAPPQPVEAFGGPTSVAGQINADTGTHARRLFEPYRAFKGTVQKQFGLVFGIDYNALFQGATASLGDDIAASGAFRLFGHWTLVGRDTPFPGNLVFKVENRHRLGTDVAPQDFAAEIGYAGLTAITFSDAGWLLTNLYWYQQLWSGRLAFVLGIVDTTDYVDLYGLVSPWADFNNFAFSNGPTMAAPSQGFGVAARGRLTDHL